MVRTETTRARAPRADAQRNRDLILDTAEQHFAEHGVRGSLDAIAKRAGIGAGTLYRHFPTREALLAALLADRGDALVARREAPRDGSVTVTDTTSRWACFALWGPRAHDVLSPLTPDPLDFPYMSMREIVVGDVTLT